MWCKVCDKLDLCDNANTNKCVMCTRNILYKDYFETKIIGGIKINIDFDQVNKLKDDLK